METTQTINLPAVAPQPQTWEAGGPSPNPGGRPRYSEVSDAFRSFLSRKVPIEIIEYKHPKTGEVQQLLKLPDLKEYFGEILDREHLLSVGHILAIQTCIMAVRGDAKARKEAIDRAEGKAIQPIDIERSEPTTIRIENVCPVCRSIEHKKP